MEPCQNCPKRKDSYYALSAEVKRQLKDAMNAADFVEGRNGDLLKARLKDIFGFRGIRGFLKRHFGVEE